MLWCQDISFWNWSFEDYSHKNNYPSNFKDWCIKSFPKRLYTPKPTVPNIPKRNVFCYASVFGKYFVSNLKEASKTVKW